jgi:hypothetical protein
MGLVLEERSVHTPSKIGVRRVIHANPLKVFGGIHARPHRSEQVVLDALPLWAFQSRLLPAGAALATLPDCSLKSSSSYVARSNTPRSSSSSAR